MKRSLFFFCILSIVALNACQTEPYLSVKPQSLSFPQKGGSQTVVISTNSFWTASVDFFGFTVSPDSGEGKTTVTVTADETTSVDTVSCNLSIKSGGLSASVSITQEPRQIIMTADGSDFDTTVSDKGGAV